MVDTEDAPVTIEDGILRGPTVEYPKKWRSLGHFVFEKLSKNRDFIGQLDTESGQKDAYRTMRERTIRCAFWMRNNYVKPGDIVAIYCANHIDVAIVCYACQYIGAIFFPIDRQITEDKVCEMMKVCKPKIIFATQKTAAKLFEEAKNVQLYVRIVSTGEVEGIEDWARCLATVCEEDVEDFECEEIESLDVPAFIVCHTHSDASPRTFSMSHLNVFRELYSSKVLDFEGDKYLSFLPTYTLQGVLDTFSTLYHKKTRCLAPSPADYRKTWRIVEKYRIEAVHMTDYACEMMVKFGAHRKCDASCVKRIMCGGGLLPKEFHKEMTDFVPDAEIFYGYGMTDVAGIVTRPYRSKKPGSCGRITENIEMKVTDLEDASDLDVNQRGELCVKNPYMMTSFLNPPQNSPEVFDGEGWLHTGDIGYFDENGEVFIEGRIDEMIIFQSVPMYPREMEAAILSHPAVREVVIISLYHHQDGHQPFAYVVKMPDAHVKERELVLLARKHVPAAKDLRTSKVEFIEGLPRTTADIVRRGDLRTHVKNSDLYKENVEKAYPGLCNPDADIDLSWPKPKNDYYEFTDDEE